MKNLFYLSAFCLVVSLLLNSGCRPAPKNSCEISRADAEKVLGTSISPIEKNAPQLGLKGTEAENAWQMRACGFVSENAKNDLPYLYWYGREFDDGEEAQQFFEEKFKKDPRTKQNRIFESIPGIGDEAILYQEEWSNKRETSIIVKKGRNIFYLIKGVDPYKGIPSDEIKALAKKISLNTID
ncbi:MAG TPA: hypothetical protein VGC76_16925 [Pyrinomonadaceae bacterium]|jgi:hypothetical protein